MSDEGPIDRIDVPCTIEEARAQGEVVGAAKAIARVRSAIDALRIPVMVSETIEADALSSANLQPSGIVYPATKNPAIIAATPVEIGYTNWRGEYGRRRIIPLQVWFGATDWHPEPQWLLRAIDADRNAERDFAIKDIGLNNVEVEQALTAAMHALRSYQYGNASPELAENVADVCEQVLASLKGGA